MMSREGAGNKSVLIRQLMAIEHLKLLSNNPAAKTEIARIAGGSLHGEVTLPSPKPPQTKLPYLEQPQAGPRNDSPDISAHGI